MKIFGHSRTRFSLMNITPLLLLQKTKTKNYEVFFNKASLCFSLLLLSGAVYAQSDDTKQVVLEKKMKGNDFIDKKGKAERNLDIYPILPTVLYNATNSYILITSHYVTFESVTYYIVDELGFVQQQGEMTLQKGDEIGLHLSQLSIGSYKIALDFCGDCFQGEFKIEQ